MARDVLDTVVAAETPEGIVLELRPAGLSARFYAFLLDWLVRLMIAYAAAIASAFMGGLGLGFWLLFYFLLEWFYPVVFELSRSGATPGKSIVGIKVVMDNGLPVTPAASFTRNLLRVADFLPFLFGAGVVSMLVRHDSKRLGDLAAATLVVHQPQRPPRIKLDDVAPVTPTMPLAPSDQAALVALAARAPTLTGERLDELAALAAAVSGDGGRAGPNVTRRVLGVAQWAMGKRA
ncbi:MAG TPA: RDD family protein [Gammaproteobacteria bacterium]|nr:RDD family protein [Gammaproteobacteria bacterium]